MHASIRMLLFVCAHLIDLPTSNYRDRWERRKRAFFALNRRLPNKGVCAAVRAHNVHSGLSAQLISVCMHKERGFLSSSFALPLSARNAVCTAFKCVCRFSLALHFGAEARRTEHTYPAHNTCCLVYAQLLSELHECSLNARPQK